MPSSRSLSTTSNFDTYLRQHSNNTPNNSDTESGYGRSRSLQSYQSETDASGRVAFCAIRKCDRYAEVYCDSECRVTSLNLRPFEWKGCGRAVCHKHSLIRHEHGDITMCRRCEGDFEQLLQENALMPSCSCFGFFRSKPKTNPETQALLKKKKHAKRRKRKKKESKQTKARKSIDYTPEETPPRSRSVLITPPQPTNV